MDLLIGCGNSRDRRVNTIHRETWDNLVTIDTDPACNPDIIHDLENFPWPVDTSTISELHAYETIEHLGAQGDVHSFFAFFNEAYRVLEPDGHLLATTPGNGALWAWGDPGHRRIVNEGSLLFLDLGEYARQVGVTPMSDYRRFMKCDFERVYAQYVNPETLAFILQAKKPARRFD